MIKKLKVLSVVILLCFQPLSGLMAQGVSTFQGLPFITNYGAESYKAGIQNWDIIQDDQGLLYVANNLGLLEFDGQDWHRYGLNNTKVRSAFLGPDRKIYVGSQADFGYLYPDENGNLNYTSLADSLSPYIRDFDETWKIYGVDEKIYFCTFERIYVYDGKTISVIDSDYRLEISFMVDNRLYTQEWGKGLSIMSEDGFELVRNGDFFKDKRISNILTYDRDHLMITTFNQGAFLYNGNIEAFRFKGDFWKDEFIINYSKRLRDGNIAIGTQNAGLFVINKEGNLLLHLNKESGLMDLTINYIYEDTQKNLWLAMNNGVARVDLNSPFTTINDRMGISGSGYTALLYDDMIYLGTNNGLFKWTNGQMEFVKGTAGQVYTIQEINGKVLMGHHNGAFLIEGGEAKLVSDEKGGWLFLPHPDDVNLLIEGTYVGLNILEWKGDQLVLKHKIKGFDESSRVMEFDGKTLWVAHGYKGVFKLSFNDDFTEVIDNKLYNSDDGFSSDVLINVFKIANQLIFTADYGFYTFNSSTDGFEALVDYNELLGESASIVDMEADEIGNVYFIERTKLGVLKPKGNHNYEIHTSSFNKVRSFWNDDLGNITVLDNNNVLIGGKQGFIHYDYQKDIPRNTPFQVLFREISNHGKRDSTVYSGYSVDGKLPTSLQNESFGFAQNSFSFNYVATHFESKAEISYQYKLENYDENWSDWSYESRKEYTNLHEGKYSFRLRAKNIYDDKTEEIQYSFRVSPPIYRSVAAYGFYSLSTMMLLFIGFKLLDKRHKKQTKELEDQQDKELKRKDTEIESITQKSEAEIVKLRNDKLQSENNFKSQALTSSAMNLIQKNQLLSDIKNSLKGITKEEANKQLTTQLARLIKSIDKDLAGGEEWSQFADNFDQVHGGFITRLKDKYPGLTPQEIKFSAYIRMNLNTKEIANLLGISVRGVEIGRYRVRKKLKLERKDNLSDFILRF